MTRHAPQGYVTAPGWFASVETTTRDQPAVLHVSRATSSSGPFRPGDADRRAFTTSQEAWRYAEEHGYLQPYHRCAPRAVWKAQHRPLCRFLAANLRTAALDPSATPATVLAAGRRARAQAMAQGCDLLASGAFELAATTIAYRLRPDIFVRVKRRSRL